MSLLDNMGLRCFAECQTNIFDGKYFVCPKSTCRNMADGSSNQFMEMLRTELKENWSGPQASVSVLSSPTPSDTIRDTACLPTSSTNGGGGGGSSVESKRRRVYILIMVAGGCLAMYAAYRAVQRIRNAVKGNPSARDDDDDDNPPPLIPIERTTTSQQQQPSPPPAPPAATQLPVSAAAPPASVPMPPPPAASTSVQEPVSGLTPLDPPVPGEAPRSDGQVQGKTAGQDPNYTPL